MCQFVPSSGIHPSWPTMPASGWQRSLLAPGNPLCSQSLCVKKLPTSLCQAWLLLLLLRPLAMLLRVVRFS